MSCGPGVVKDTAHFCDPPVSPPLRYDTQLGHKNPFIPHALKPGIRKSPLLTTHTPFP